MSKYQCRECLHCKELFLPHRRNAHHQKFCSKPECRKASKAESQRRWLSKEENQDQFRGPENVQRVQQWRKANPGYWKRTRKRPRTLQEVLPEPNRDQVTEPQQVAPKSSQPPLQDLLPASNPTQDPLLVGLISHLIDSPLQDDIDQAAHRLIFNGMTILGMSPGGRITQNENQKTNPLSGTAPPHSRTV